MKHTTTTEQKIKIMQAYLDGRTIELQYQELATNWEFFTLNPKDSAPTWNWETIIYRIKKEPTIRYGLMNKHGSMLTALSNTKEGADLRLITHDEPGYYKVVKVIIED